MTLASLQPRSVIMALLCIACCLHVVAVHCMLPPYCGYALHFASMLLLCIACYPHIVAMHCTLPLCCCCALHLASEVVHNKFIAKRQVFLTHEGAQSGASGSQHAKTAGTKLQNPSLVSSAGWHLKSMVHLQQALSESNASKPDDTGARRRPAKLLLQ